MNKIPYPSESKLRFEEWSNEDLKKYLISIGIDPTKEQNEKENKRKKKNTGKKYSNQSRVR